jgi:hypothetical protein
MVLQEPTNEDPDYAEWFNKPKTNFVTDKANKVVPKIIQDLKDMGYRVPGNKLKDTTEAIKRFQYHFYSGNRYHLRFRPDKKDAGKFPDNSGGTWGGKQGNSPPGKANRDLARRIRAVADYVRSREKPVGDFSTPPSTSRMA